MNVFALSLPSGALNDGQFIGTLSRRAMVENPDLMRKSTLVDSESVATPRIISSLASLWRCMAEISIHLSDRDTVVCHL